MKIEQKRFMTSGVRNKQKTKTQQKIHSIRDMKNYSVIIIPPGGVGKIGSKFWG